MFYPPSGVGGGFMFSLALFFYLLGFGTLLMDARLRDGYSLALAGIAGTLIALAMVFFVTGMLRGDRLHSDSHDSLP